MTMGYLTALRNNQLDEITALVDAGAGAGKIRIYDGAQPATGGTATVLLSENVMSDPSFPAASSGVLTASAITDDTSANAAGTATWFRIVDSNDVFVLDGTVGLTSSGSDLELSSVVFSIGLNVSISSLVVTNGNP